MNKIRLLIVDDAVVSRRLLTRVLAADPALEVVGTAPNGAIALAKVAQLAPDVVILDLEMPEMDGLQTLATLRKTQPHLPVIMFSRHNQRGAARVLEALALGANDFVALPEQWRGWDETLDDLREQLVARIKLFCRPRGDAAVAAKPLGPPITKSPSWSGISSGPPVEVVVIGTSTGGPNALAALLPVLPADCPVPILIVQHMPPLFTRMLAERLDGSCPLAVREAVEGADVAPGQVWIAPGDHHLTVARSGADVRLRLHQGPPENACRPSADVLFRSAAEVYGSGVLAVVLTGMGQDGFRGCERVCAAGGRALAQDEATSVVWGMPGFVARAGLADKILPLEQIGHEILRRVRLGRSLSFPGLRST